VHDLHAEAVEEDGALLVGLRVSVYDREPLRFPPGCEVVPDGHVRLPGDGDVELQKPLEGLPHAAGLRVLDRDEALYCAGRHAPDDGADGRQEEDVVAVEPDREIVAERPGRPEGQDRHRFTTWLMRSSVSSVAVWR